MLIFAERKYKGGNHNYRAADAEQAAEKTHHNPNSC